MWINDFPKIGCFPFSTPLNSEDELASFSFIFRFVQAHISWKKSIFVEFHASHMKLASTISRLRLKHFLIFFSYLIYLFIVRIFLLQWWVDLLWLFTREGRKRMNKMAACSRETNVHQKSQKRNGFLRNWVVSNLEKKEEKRWEDDKKKKIVIKKKHVLYNVRWWIYWSE